MIDFSSKINYQDSLNVDTELPFYRPNELIFSILGAMNKGTNFDLVPLMNKAPTLLDSFEQNKRSVEEKLLNNLDYIKQLRINVEKQFLNLKKKY